MKNVITVLCIGVFLFMGGVFVSQEVNAAAHMCFVPYNIKVGTWNTGIHIMANFSTSEKFRIRFFSGAPPVYREVALDLADYPGGWTGTIEQLLNLPEWGVVEKKNPAAPPVPAGPTFLSPSRIYIYSTNSWFTVTQFIFYGTIGYGFQTFQAWPQSMGWPYVAPSPTAMPLSEDMWYEGECVDCDEPDMR